jgi:hypothetical protein
MVFMYISQMNPRGSPNIDVLEVMSLGMGNLRDSNTPSLRIGLRHGRRSLSEDFVTCKLLEAGTDVNAQSR